MKRFWGDRRGNFAIMGSLAFLTLALAIGGTVDISMVMRSGTAAQGAADAAALAGAKRMETGTADEAQATIQSVALANLPNDLKGAQIKGEIDAGKGVVGVTISGQYDTAFLRLARMDAIPYTRSSLSTIKRDGFMDFYFLLDVSESMNIAADAMERAKLLQITAIGNGRPCAFACHHVEKEHGDRSVYEMNEAQGANRARLRIDVLKDAFATTVDELLEINKKPDKNLTIAVATAGFSASFEAGMKPNKDAEALRASIQNFEVANGHTNYLKAMDGLANFIGTQNDGSDAEKPEKVAVLITDGVKDIEQKKKWDLGPIDDSYCNKIKSKGIKLAVLEIKYIDDYDIDGFFRDRVAWYYNSITPQLKKCASPGLHYLATDSRQAAEKLKSLANDIVRQNLRIRQ